MILCASASVNGSKRNATSSPLWFQRGAGFKPGLEVAQDKGPTTGDELERRGFSLKIVMDEGQHRDITRRREFPGDARRTIGLRLLVAEVTKGHYQAAGRIELEHRTFDGDNAARLDEMNGRANLPGRTNLRIEEVTLGQLGINDRVPDPVDRRADIDVIDQL